MKKTGFQYKEKHFPKLQDSDKNTDPTKKWVISFYLYNEGTGKLERIRRSISPTKDNKNNLKARQKEIQAIIADIKKEMLAGAYIAEKQAPTLSEITLKEALDKYKAHKNTVDMKKLVVAVTNNLQDLWQTALPALTQKQLESVLKNLPISAYTRNIYKIILKGAAKWWVSEDMLPQNICQAIPLEKTAESDAHHPFTEEERQQILAYLCDNGMGQVALMCEFIYYTLARPHRELKDLRVEDIKETTIHFKASTAKNRKKVHINIAPSLEKLIQTHKLREYPPKYYIFGGETAPTENITRKSRWFYEAHRKALIALGLTEQRHTLYAHKHSGAIAMAMRAKNMQHYRMIQKMCRHASIQQTEEYLRKMGVNMELDTDFLA